MWAGKGCAGGAASTVRPLLWWAGGGNAPPGVNGLTVCAAGREEGKYVG